MPATSAATALPAALLLLVALLALPLAGCGRYDDDHYDGNVFVANRTDTTTPEQALSFRLAGFGHPFSGNLLAAPLGAGGTQYVGPWFEDYYDAQSEMAGGDLVEWFDRWVGHATDTYFDIF